MKKQSICKHGDRRCSLRADGRSAGFGRLHRTAIRKLGEQRFVLRYLEGKEVITGYGYEPWLIRYVDDPAVAKEIMDAGITLEEYLGVADGAKAAKAAAEAEQAKAA